MEKIDARKLPDAALEEKRRQAVHLSKQGMTRAAIGEIVGVHADTVGRWLKAYATSGGSALKSKRRGGRVGEVRLLDAEEERKIRAQIIDKTPDQLKMSYALWTSQTVQELIARETGVALAVRTVGEYQKRWGMTQQKRAYEQRAPEVKAWLEEEYPAIQERAKQEDAEIYWGDETGLRNDCQHERGYAPKVKTPVIRLNAKRESINMISAITNQGKVRFRIFDGKMNADVLIDFMMRLLNEANRKVYLILDDLRVHHAKTVKEWLEEHKEMIQVFYFPAYSPELNPDEYLNCDLKASVHSGMLARSKEQLTQKTSGHMHMLQRKPNRVRKYFKHEKIRYAA
ncbi:MAG: IS630 family transposase [Gammaproteobacteria bacterium]|nr:IS630 family transposase [Gammaproteobacteria bacterium]